MNDVDKKSIGGLIDELITTSMKCWFAQEIIMKSDKEKEISEAAIKAQQLNARRNKLINAIDKRFGEDDISSSEKTYG